MPGLLLHLSTSSAVSTALRDSIATHLSRSFPFSASAIRRILWRLKHRPVIHCRITPSLGIKLRRDRRLLIVPIRIRLVRIMPPTPSPPYAHTPHPTAPELGGGQDHYRRSRRRRGNTCHRRVQIGYALHLVLALAAGHDCDPPDQAGEDGDTDNGAEDNTDFTAG